MKRPDEILLIAVWNFFSILIAIIGMVALVLFAYPIVNNLYDIARTGGLFGLAIAMLFLACYVVLAILGGIGILLGKEWGRIICLIQAALSLFAIPFGTIIGIFIIIYLGKPEVKDFFAPAGK